jgi:hypothetical protein
MEIEFDKEIDAILRSAAKGSNSVNLTSEHLDADEISLFAENVLPANARVKALEHLADCNRCRKILVEISAFVADETPSEIARIVEIKTEIPWYKTLFAFPNLAYSLGGLFVLFAGIIGFVAFQSKSSINSDVAVAEKSTYSKGASSDGNEATKEVLTQNSNSAVSASNATTAVANTPANTASQLNLPKDTTPNSAVAANVAPNLPQTSPTAPVLNQPNIAPKNQPIERSRAKEETVGEPKTEALPVPKPAENKPAVAAIVNDGIADKSGESNKTDSEQKLKSLSTNDSAIKTETDEDEVTRSAPMKPTTTIKLPQNARKIAKDNQSESKQVSGKKFRKIGGTWFDSAYGSQPQTNVSRGSADYKKLDSGLQNIGNSLDGTVIVVWKSKAYKIQ